WTLGMGQDGAPVPEQVELLAQTLGARGWATGAFVSSVLLHQNLGFARGFARYDDEFGWLPGFGRTLPGRLVALRGRTAPLERRGGETIARALDWLEARDRAWFAWVHLFDPHGPYAPPPP